MAFFTYKCSQHGNFKVSLEKRDKTVPCPTCGEDSRSVLKAGNVQVNERLDNGLMPRAVERPQNIEEMIRERAENDPQRKRIQDAGPKD